MNTHLAQLILNVQALPPERRAEVEAFVDFLLSKDRKQATVDRLLAIPPALQAAVVKPVTTDESSAEIKAARTRHHSPTGRR
jgi:hypothetical protein